jgi:hypothetical protein
MKKLSIAALPLVLSDFDRADLEKMRNRIAEWAGEQDGPADNVLVYFAFLELVKRVDAFERTGNSYNREMFAKSFYDDVEEEEDFPSDPNDPMDRWCFGCGQWLYLGCECNEKEARRTDAP